MRRRLPASASDASREALWEISSKKSLDPKHPRSCASLLEKSDRQPWHGRDDHHADGQYRQIGPQIPHRPVGIGTPNLASDVEADAEGRQEEAEAHGEDSDDGIVDAVDSEALRDRKHQRAEEHQGRKPF